MKRDRDNENKSNYSINVKGSRGTEVPKRVPQVRRSVEKDQGRRGTRTV